MSWVTDKVCQAMQYTNIRRTNIVYVSLRTDSVPIAPNTQQAEWSVSFGELRLGPEPGNRCYEKLHKITIKVSVYARQDGTWGSGGTARLILTLGTRMYGVSLYIQGTDPWYPFRTRPDGSHSVYGCFGKDGVKTFLTQPEIELGFLIL
jgi:hypothetical protein